MANFVFLEATGRVGGYVDRVLNNDPATSALIAIVMSQSGTAEQAEGLTTFAAVEANANFAEATGGTTPWGRKTIDETGEGLTIGADTANNRNEADFNDLVYTPSADTPDATGIVICYDSDTGAGTDANLIPLVHLDFVVVSDGNQITYQVNAEGWYNATRV